MYQYTDQITLNTYGRKLYDITPMVLQIAKAKVLQTGLMMLYIQHTSASLLINENYDADVLVDMEAFFNRLVPDGDPLFIYTIEGPDDMPAHIRSALTQTQVSIPIIDGMLALGQWQGIFVYEHRHSETTRRVLLHFIGE